MSKAAACLHNECEHNSMIIASQQDFKKIKESLPMKTFSPMKL